MKFPVIERIEDVLPAIEGRSEFIVAEREGFTVINYMVAFDTTFPDLSVDDPIPLMLRECRGLMFDRDGKLISRPYAKFFNMNEREETLASEFALEDTSKYVLMDKLDGSFIRPVRIDGIIRLCTKMGVTEQSLQAEEFLESQSEEVQDQYSEFFEAYVDHFTPIFEFCSRKNQVVIDYPQDALILTGLRHNETGDYITYKTMKNICSVFKIPCVRAWSIEEIIGQGVPYCSTRVMDAVREWIGLEGVVLRYTDGRMVKIKAEDYCIKHGAKDALLHEKNVLSAFLGEKLDDVLPLLDETFRGRVEAYTAEVSKGIEHAVWSVDSTFRMLMNHFESRKDRAIYINTELDPLFRSVLFSMLDGKKSTRQIVIDKVLSNTKTQTEVDSMRPFIGKAEWL